MNENDDITSQVRDSFATLRMATPVETIMTRSRTRQRRRLTSFTAVAAAGAGAAAVLVFGGLAPAGSASPSPASLGSAKLTSFTVASGPGGSTTLTLSKGQRNGINPSELQEALGQHNIPAVVINCGGVPGGGPSAGAASSGRTSVGAASSGSADHSQAVRVTKTANGATAFAIERSAMPSGEELSIALFPGGAAIALTENGTPLSCSSIPPITGPGHPATPESGKSRVSLGHQGGNPVA